MCERLKKLFLLNEVLDENNMVLEKTKLTVNQVVDELINLVRKIFLIALFFLDLAKAVNTVNHNILVSKLKSYNIKGSMLSLLKTF